ncbi:hypothetical protein [uncultured Hymenobacter sp.]|uniref:hypothetical protein n=1 Tax=uncultured Hymenobacter sp. TaxID=170016 RepID=UPI0035CADDCD
MRGPTGTSYQLLNQLSQLLLVGTSQLSRNAQPLPAGLYLLRDETAGRTSKFVKE